MSGAAETYAAITPARNEAVNLERLASSLKSQIAVPSSWIVVDSGSTDDTVAVAESLAADSGWIQVVTVDGEASPEPGAPVVRAFHAGLAELTGEVDIVVKLDADVSFEPDYFERLLAAFRADESLGIASGDCYEESEGGRWKPIYVTAGHARGATRAYRWQCLQDVLPLVEGVGWDGIDEVKASILGWRTGCVAGLPFYHHRKLGARDGRRSLRWARQGHAAHYMGYRPSYLILRTLHHARRDPAAAAMLTGYIQASFRRSPRYPDVAVRDHLRAGQRFGSVHLRVLEALGRKRRKVM
jgi:glycosyltransferase involved in cell wall biosynthesis